jgi:hypothetical protein
LVGRVDINGNAISIKENWQCHILVVQCHLRIRCVARCPMWSKQTHVTRDIWNLCVIHEDNKVDACNKMRRRRTWLARKNVPEILRATSVLVLAWSAAKLARRKTATHETRRIIVGSVGAEMRRSIWNGNEGPLVKILLLLWSRIIFLSVSVASWWRTVVPTR